MKYLLNQTTNRFTWFLMAAGIFLLLAGIILGQSLEQKLTSMGGDLGTGKITASIRNELNPSPSSYFSLKDFDKLTRNINDANITCLSRILTPVKNDYQSVTAVVNGVNHTHPKFHRLILQDGVFFTSQAQAGRSAVAVVDAALAVQLFNTGQVTGVNITVFNRRFKIIGVVAPEQSMISVLTDSGLPNLYIPVDLLNELAPDARISHIQLQTADTGTTGKNSDDLNNALQSISKNPANFKIIDYNIQKVIIGQKPQLIILLLWLLIACRLIVYLKSRFQSAYRQLRGDYQVLYLPSLLRQNRRLLTGLLIKMAAVSGVILFLWNWTAFDWYIPPEYIPDELIDLQYFVKLFQGKIRETINSIGYIPSPEELALHTIGKLSNLFFGAGIIGLFLFYGGLRRRRGEPRPLQGNQLVKSAVYGALLFLAALLLVTVIGRSLGLEVNPELKNLVMVWVFLFGSFVIGDKRQKSSLTSARKQQSGELAGL